MMMIMIGDADDEDGSLLSCCVLVYSWVGWHGGETVTELLDALPNTITCFRTAGLVQNVVFLATGKHVGDLESLIDFLSAHLLSQVLLVCEDENGCCRQILVIETSVQ